MSRKLLILLIPISSITIEAEARVRFNNCFQPQNSAINNGHGITLTTKTEACINHVHRATKIDRRAYAFVPNEIEAKGFTMAPPPTSSTKQQNVFKAVIVVVILTVTSSGITIVIRLICNCRRGVGLERFTYEENESKSLRMERIGPERPSYEPRPVEGVTLNYELTICKCNNTFALCGLPV